MKYLLNLGLSEELKLAFPTATAISVDRPLITWSGIPDTDWVAGFIDGEGCFYVKAVKNAKYSAGYSVGLLVQISQDSRDNVLMQ